MKRSQSLRLQLGGVIRSRLPIVTRTARCIRRWWQYRQLRPEVTPLGFYFAMPGGGHWGAHEELEINWISSLLSRIDVFVDVGANVGMYTVLARSHGKHVMAFEPLPANLKVLLYNLKANHFEDVEVWPMGLARSPRLTTIYGEATGASLLNEWGGGHSASAGEATTIPLTSLDIAVGQRFLEQRLLIKIDVEGAELGVLQGAQQLLVQSPKPMWFVEICLQQNRLEINQDFVATFEEFWKCGYRAYRLKSGLVPVSRSQIESYARRAFCDNYGWFFRDEILG